jgi:hypothetical protein
VEDRVDTLEIEHQRRGHSSSRAHSAEFNHHINVHKHNAPQGVPMET